MNMTKQLNGSLYYLVANVRYSFIIFWIILMVMLAVTIISALLVPDSVISFQLAAPIYVFAAVIGFWTVKNAFPYLIKMGSTRKNIFLSFGIYALLLSLLNAVIANSVNSIVALIFGGKMELGFITVTENGSTMTNYHLGDFLGENSWITRVFIDTSISFFFLAVMFIIGLIFYRFGLIGGFSFIGAGVIIFILGMSKGWLLDFFAAIFRDFSIIFFYQLLVTGILIYLVSFLLIRRITI